MKLEDVDVALEHSTGSIRLSELTHEDMREIRALSEYIINEKIFEDDYQAIIAAFHVFLESFVESNLQVESGKALH